LHVAPAYLLLVAADGGRKIQTGERSKLRASKQFGASSIVMRDFCRPKAREGEVWRSKRLGCFLPTEMLLLALNCRRSRLLSRQLLVVQRTRLPQASAAASDPERHFSTVNYCIAKGSFDHLVGEQLHLIASLASQRSNPAAAARLLRARVS
jgi:hypothetical protein